MALSDKDVSEEHRRQAEAKAAELLIDRAVDLDRAVADVLRRHATRRFKLRLGQQWPRRAQQHDKQKTTWPDANIHFVGAGVLGCELM